GPIQSCGSNLVQSTLGATITPAPGAPGPGLSINIGGYSPHDIFGMDPRLGPLQNNGGPTQTMALLTGSPAIATGDVTYAPRIDQRGYTRVSSFDNPRIDMGAYAVRVGGAPATPPVMSCDGSTSGGLTIVKPSVTVTNPPWMFGPPIIGNPS